jgi:4-hydroxy-tetrahydrodipicolinate synthase
LTFLFETINLGKDDSRRQKKGKKMKPSELIKNYPRTVVALVTPIRQGEIDEDNLRKLIRFHLRAGTPAVLVCGTTGESATMTHNEHKKVIAVGVETVKGYREENPDSVTQIWAGTGSNSTREALDLTRYAEEAGVDVGLVITPYYNKPTPKGMVHHFRTIAEAVEMPLVPYNVPSRTGINLATSTVVEIAGVSNIVGVKEASGNIGQISEIAAETPEGFLVWSGDDAMTLPILSVGGVGVISVTANIVPWDIEALCQAFAAGDFAEALRLHRRLYNLHRGMFVETNPIPVKTSVNLLYEAYKGGVPDCASGSAAEYLPYLPSAGEFRSPLVNLTDASLAALKKALREYRLLP